MCSKYLYWDDPQITLVETKRVRALYEHLAARIDEKDFKGPVVPLGQGVPQGGPHKQPPMQNGVSWR